jgi:hypothetical protein
LQEYQVANARDNEHEFKFAFYALANVQWIDRSARHTMPVSGRRMATGPEPIQIGEIMIMSLGWLTPKPQGDCASFFNCQLTPLVPDASGIWNIEFVGFYNGRQFKGSVEISLLPFESGSEREMWAETTKEMVQRGCKQLWECAPGTLYMLDPDSL